MSSNVLADSLLLLSRPIDSWLSFSGLRLQNTMLTWRLYNRQHLNILHVHKAWNRLPTKLKTSTCSTDSFKRSLKTFLFQSADGCKTRVSWLLCNRNNCCICICSCISELCSYANNEQTEGGRVKLCKNVVNVNVMNARFLHRRIRNKIYVQYTGTNKYLFYAKMWNLNYWA